MSHAPSGVFAAITQYFADPRVQEDVRLTLTSKETAGEPASLSATEVRDTLFGPYANSALSTAIWKEALDAARNEESPQGPHQLLLIWLILPRLVGTVRRICWRLRVDSSDVEAEMVLAILERLRTVDSEGPLPIEALMTTARSTGWHFARAGLREKPSLEIHDIADTVDGDAQDTEQLDELEVEITRPDGPDGFCTPLRFAIPEELLEDRTLGLHEVVRRAVRPGRKRHIGNVPPRIRARRR